MAETVEPNPPTTPSSRRPLRVFASLAAALVILAILLAIVAWLPIRRARDEWRGGRNAEAIATAENWSRIRLWPNQYHQLLAVSYLSVGNDAAARPHLESLRGHRIWIPAIAKTEVARRLFERGRYQAFLAYDDASQELRTPAEARLDRAAALAAVNRLDDAATALQNVGSSVDAARADTVRRAIDERRRGSYPVAVDREGKTIAVLQVANNDVVAVNTDFQPLVDAAGSQLTLERATLDRPGHDLIETTLDPDVQKAALFALGGFRGALVAIDPKTNEILAIATNRGQGPEANLALDAQYEPGSVIKVLTILNALERNVPLDSMFPYTCTGNLAIDGRQFGDWLPGGHGVLPDVDEALAESCNVVFGDVGLRIGPDGLLQFMHRAGFDTQADLGLWHVPLGRNVGRLFNRFETAYYAIGLEHETATPLHIAMLASAVANRGVLTTPRLVRARRSILGDVTEQPPVQAKEQLASKEHAERVIRAMTAVATRPKGTGRRAPIDGVTIALKTGTAGKREAGYNATIMAFAPVESPKIAFAVMIENSGPAEFGAAKVAHDFLARIEPRLK